MSDSDSEISPTPPEIVLQAATALNSILPEKSKDRYEKVYQKFIEWSMDNHVSTYSENVLLAYFNNLTKTYKPSSLWAIYSMLRATLNIRHNINIENYSKLKAYLKRQSDGYKSKKSKILTAKEIKTFLEQAPDREFLFMKVALIIGISGACRKQELRNLKTSDIEDTGKNLIIKICDTKNKIPRSFIISGSFYNICMKYITMRNAIKETSICNFFLNFQKGKLVRQPVGINKLGAVPKNIAKYLKLPDAASYTGHCFRRTSATILVDAGGDLMALKRLGGWKSSTVAEGYVDESITNKTATSEKILQSIDSNLPSNSTMNVEDNETQSSISSNILTMNTSVSEKSIAPFIINSCKNFTINFNTNNGNK